MPVIVLEARDLASPLFLVRTFAILCECFTFSLAASSDYPNGVNTFRIFCMFIWCFFFVLSLLIHVLATIQFHSLIPVSWKNLTVTVAALGALTCLSACVIYPWIVMEHSAAALRAVMAAVAACLTFLAYSCETLLTCTQAQEQRGYMGSGPGLLKILQLWGGCQMIPVIVEDVKGMTSSNKHLDMEGWHLYVLGASCGICILMSLVTLVVIVGDLAGRCFLPFDRLLAVFSLFGLLLYMVATVVCFTRILQLRDHSQHPPRLVIMETVIATITLLAYTVDLAVSAKVWCDRCHA